MDALLTHKLQAKPIDLLYQAFSVSSLISGQTRQGLGKRLRELLAGLGVKVVLWANTVESESKVGHHFAHEGHITFGVGVCTIRIICVGDHTDAIKQE